MQPHGTAKGTNGHRRIVVINDHAEYLDLIECQLDAAGYQVAGTRDPGDALRLIKDEKPDLVVLGIGPPNQEGWPLLDLLKLEPSTRDLPIILTSAAVSQLREVEGFLRDKGCLVLPQPFFTEELLAVVHRALATPTRRERPAG